MGYFIDYAVLCDKGKTRFRNQDNFWCAGKFLECGKDRLTAPVSGSSPMSSRPAFAVFDGLGGEKYGDIAAFLAVTAFDAYISANKGGISFSSAYLYAKMNDDICRYMKDKNIKSMGATAAAALFCEKTVYISNIGDSRIFRLSANKLTQITHDHITTVSHDKKPALAQYLGIPPAEFIIEPYVTECGYKRGDRFLLCTDGLTDMLATDEIRKILLENTEVSECAAALMNQALNNGGADNITVILCGLRCEKGLFNRMGSPPPL